MLTPLGTPEDLARLKQERDEADRAYNEALTALDHAIMRVRELPPPPPPYDEFQITPLNQRWDVLAAKPAGRGGWAGCCSRSSFPISGRCCISGGGPAPE